MSSNDFHTCRFCKDTIFEARNTPFIKYGVRHYAHPTCFIKAGHTLEELSDHQIGQLPYFWLKENGLLEEAERRLKCQN